MLEKGKDNVKDEELVRTTEASISLKAARNSQYCNSIEVARVLGVSPRTVCYWAECGELSAFKIGRRWFFKKAEIEERLK